MIEQQAFPWPELGATPTEVVLIDPTRLHLFIREESGCGDVVIAYDADDARRIMIEDVVGEEAFAHDARNGEVFERWPDDTPFTITDVDEPGPPQETKLPAQWAEVYGRGYLGGWA